MDELLEILKGACPNIDFSKKDLISSGAIDSLSFVNIISAIEEKLNISLDIMSIGPDDFESIESILELVNKNR